MVKKVLCLMLFTAMNVVCRGQSKEQWVDSVFQQLSLEEKIGQLFMQEVDLITDEAQQRFMSELKEHHLGGLMITGGIANTVKQNIKQFQAASKVPLLTALDAEWGAGKTFNYQITGTSTERPWRKPKPGAKCLDGQSRRQRHPVLFLGK